MAKAYLLGRDGLLAGLAELLNDPRVVTQILLAADEDDREALAEVQNFRDPLQAAGHVSAFRLGGDWGDGIERVLTFSWTLSRESGESTAKQIRMTCESG